MLFMDNEMGIFIFGVLSYLFIKLLKRLKEYDGFSKEIRDETEEIIDENMKGKVKYGVIISIILSLIIWFKIDGGYIGVYPEISQLSVDEVPLFLPELYSLVKKFIRFLNLMSLFLGFLLIYLTVQLYNIKLKKEISFLAKLNYIGGLGWFFSISLIISASLPLFMRMIGGKML